MPPIMEFDTVSKKKMVVFFVVDPTLMNAEGMQSTWLWEALERGREGVKAAFEQSEDTEMKMAVLIAGEHPQWLMPEGPMDVNLPCPELVPDVHCRMGEALTELCSKMLRREFMHSSTGMRMPAVLFITGGTSEDDDEQPLKSIWENKWFQNALKIAIHVGPGESAMAEKLMGDQYGVVCIRDCGALADWLEALVPGLLINFINGKYKDESSGRSPNNRLVSQDIVLAEKELKMVRSIMVPDDELWNERSDTDEYIDVVEFLDGLEWEDSDDFV